jgi:uncharacterized protein (TIGR00730 family)
VSEAQASKPAVVTVFGGSRVHPGTALYDEAVELGRLLGRAGYAVCNGGYMGTMEAVSRGCKEVGGRTIGVTVEIFSSTRSPNEYLDEVVGTASLLMRLDKLTALADAYVVMAGSVGTLLELLLVWNLRQLHVYPDKPIILVGPAWRTAIEAVNEHLLVQDADVTLLSFAEHPRDVLTLLEAAGVRPSS